jgi:hypothetical protein
LAYDVIVGGYDATIEQHTSSKEQKKNLLKVVFLIRVALNIFREMNRAVYDCEAGCIHLIKRVGLKFIKFKTSTHFTEKRSKRNHKFYPSPSN